MRAFVMTVMFLAGGTPGYGQDAAAVAGTWAGPWTNSLKEKGVSALKLTADKDGGLKGTWDGVNVSGKWSEKHAFELHGKSATRSYQFNGTVAEGKMTLKYVATKLDANGTYKGEVHLHRTFEPGPATKQQLPAFTWLDKTQKGLPKCFATKEVVLVGVSWDGSMAREVCQAVYDSALQKAFSDKTSLEKLSLKSGLNSKHVYLFGFYDVTDKTGDWFTVFPRVRTSNGGPGCERAWSTGDRKRTTDAEEVIWRRTNGEAVSVRYESTSKGFKYRMFLGNPDIEIRGK